MQPFVDPCAGVTMTTTSMANASYTAGAPIIDISIADFDQSPAPDPSCPAVVHTYTYMQVSGPAIDASWIIFNTSNKVISFTAPIYVGDYNLVAGAVISVFVSQTVTDSFGATYETATDFFQITMSEGTIPCDELTFNPTSYNDVNFDIIADGG